jgi:hypothetical protein
VYRQIDPTTQSQATEVFSADNPSFSPKDHENGDPLNASVSPLERHCLECGAPRVNGMTCQEQLAAILGWENQDRDLFNEHFFTVASFNLQHPAQFTDVALDALRSGFIEVFDGTTPFETLRRRTAARFEGKRRVLKDEADRLPSLRQWKMTIADVYDHDRPQGAAERVRSWAAAIRSEL